MAIKIILLIDWAMNIIINAVQIKYIVGCSFILGAAILSSLTNAVIRKAENKPTTPDQKEDIELEEITIGVQISNIPMPKP